MDLALPMLVFGRFRKVNFLKIFLLYLFENERPEVPDRRAQIGNAQSLLW